MQTVHNVFPALGAPGQLFDVKEGNDIVSAIAGEDLQPGRWVELSSGSNIADDKTTIMTVQLCQQTSSTCAPQGVVVRDMQREQNNWPDNTSQGIKKGSRVSILRRGRIFVERDSADTATVSRFSSFNIMHSSTDTSKRGMVSLASTSTTTGAEITAQTVSQAWQDSTPGAGVASSSVALLEVYVK